MIRRDTNTLGRAAEHSARSVMTELTGHHLQAPEDVEATLTAITTAAVGLIDGVDYADVMLVADEKVESRAPTDPIVADLDAVQLRLNEGPCLKAAITDTVISCPNLANDPRWPGFAAAAIDAGVHSMLSFPLYKHRGGGGALNLMGSTIEAMDYADHAIAAMLATHAAVALMAADRLRQFQAALASRDLIGQAKGIVMERFNVDAQRAFELITKLSQETNTPVRTIAGKIAEAG
jgi:transcriptional regulator with GAF, ATPase, and Fis domain